MVENGPQEALILSMAIKTNGLENPSIASVNLFPSEAIFRAGQRAVACLAGTIIGRGHAGKQRKWVPE